MKDISGKTVKVGDFLVYAADSSLHYAKVLKTKKMERYPGSGHFKDIIQVRTVYKSYKGWSKDTRNLNPYGGRFLVVKKGSIPANLRKGFEELE